MEAASAVAEVSAAPILADLVTEVMSEIETMEPVLPDLETAAPALVDLATVVEELSADIATVAPVIADLATVAPVIAEMATVAPAIADLATAAPAIAELATAAPAIADLATAAPAIADLATAAPAIADLATAVPDIEDLATASEEGPSLMVLQAYVYISVGLVIVVITILSYLVTSLVKAHLRNDPGRWPQVFTALCILLAVPLRIALMSRGMLPAACHVVLPMACTLGILVMLGILLTMVERTAGVIKKDPESPGFTPTTLIGLMIGAVLVSTIISLSILYGTGGISPVTIVGYEGTYCVVSDAARFSTDAIEEILCVLLLVGAVVLTIVLCVVRRGADKPYPVGKVVPVIVGSLVVFLIFLIDFLAYFGWVFDGVFLSYLLLVFIWMFGDAEVRQAYTSLFCACCPTRQKDSEREILLNNRAGSGMP